MGWWFRAVLAAMADPSSTSCSPKDARNTTLDITKTVSCAPDVQSWRDVVKGVVQFHPQATYVTLYACCALGVFAALYIAGSPTSAWQHLRRTQRVKAVWGRSMVSLVSLFTALVMFVGCVQEQIFPGGVPPEGMRCGSMGAVRSMAAGASGASGVAGAAGALNDTAIASSGSQLGSQLGVNVVGATWASPWAVLYSFCALLSLHIRSVTIIISYYL